MNQEQKAKAYDEALDWMREIYPTMEGIVKEDAEHYFPELKEGEDERMRKRAIAILKQQRDYWSYDGPMDKFPPAAPRKDLVDAIDVALSYLEKQKEPLTPEEKMNHPLYLEGFDVGRKVEEALKEQKPADDSGTAEPDYGICDDYIPAALLLAMARHGWYAGHIEEDEKSVLERKEYVARNWPSDKDNLTQEQPLAWCDEDEKEKPKPKWDDSDMREDENELLSRFAFYVYKDEPDVLYLSNVFVEKTFRNIGVGAKILIAAEKVAETIGAISIRLKVVQDSPVNSWYRKRGYGYITFEGEYDWLQKNLEYMKPNNLSIE